MCFSGMEVSQTWWRFVRCEAKKTGMELPPRRRFSVCRGWWMSPRNWRILVRMRVGGWLRGEREN